MKTRQKYLSILLISIILLIVSALSASSVNAPLPHFYVQSPYSTEAEDIAIFDAEDGNYYVFLPSYADMRQVTVALSEKKQYSLGVTDLVEGMDCSGFELETPYDFAVNKKSVATLWFCQSANVATMYIDTVTGSMDQIHDDKDYEEYASLLLYTSEGTLDFQDEFAALKGRGNSTWHYDKRPYLLTLSSDADLLGMDAATKWVLLANARDETNLNNKLIMDFAKRIELGWSPKCEFIDLYLNGEYFGLYLLAEKVEVAPSRLNLDIQNGDFLCKIDYASRWDALNNPIYTQSGRVVEITSPDILTENYKTNIVTAINQMEQIIMSKSDLAEVGAFDLDSWGRRYLIDEVFGNVDADLASSYFYCLDGTFFAGPIWDYDLTFGNSPRNQNPTAFVAKKMNKSDYSTFPYYNALYTNESFYIRMVELYQSEFLPLIKELIDKEIPDIAEQIRPAATMNSLRWQAMYRNLQAAYPNLVYTVDGLISYLENRVSFLNSAWIEETQYCTIQFVTKDGDIYLIASTEKGSLLTTQHLDLENTLWVDVATGRVVDFRQPILKDMVLTTQDDQIAQDEAKETFSTRDYVTLLSIMLLFSLLLCFVCIDIMQRKKKGEL